MVLQSVFLREYHYNLNAHPIYKCADWQRAFANQHIFLYASTEIGYFPNCAPELQKRYIKDSVFMLQSKMQNFLFHALCCILYLKNS